MNFVKPEQRAAALIIPGIKTAQEAGESSVCGLQMMFKGLGSTFTLGKVKPADLPDNCRVNDVFIDEDMVEDYLDEAEEAIKKYRLNPQKYSEVLEFFDESDERKWEWALDKVLAEQLFDCWARKASFGAVDTTDYMRSNLDCLWCAKIKFDESLRKKINPKKYFVKGPPYIGSLGPFLRAEEKGYEFKGKATKRTYDAWINNLYQFYPLREIPYHLHLVDKKGKPDSWALVYAMDSHNFIVEVTGFTYQKSWMSFFPAKNLKKELYWFGSSMTEHNACEEVFGE